MPERHKRKHLTSFQMIILGFAGVILLGALLLMLPVSSVEGVVTPFDQALFTSTSAVCVTGLVVQDTGSYWSGFGQAVILLLIQTGGLGVVTVAVSVFMLSGRKISLMQRSTMQDAISAPKVGGIVRLTKFILRGTFLIEGIGAVLLLPVFCRDFGIKGIWMSIFHSISAFCNAGFDILGTVDNTFVSLSGYAGNFWLNIVIMLLIIIGGIGFLTWDDVYTNKLRFKRYRMQSKIILLTTAILIFVPAIFFFVCDFGQVSIGKRTLLSLFQSVTTRTAGFNTADLSSMTEVGQAIMILLMLMGGSPSSTAGGMKTTTVVTKQISKFPIPSDSRKLASVLSPIWALVTKGRILLTRSSLISTAMISCPISFSCIAICFPNRPRPISKIFFMLSLLYPTVIFSNGIFAFVFLLDTTA